MSTGAADSPGWALRSLVWLVQTVAASLVLFLGVAVAGIAREFSPPTVLLGCAMLVGPILLLRQASLLVDQRLASSE